jgi:hypothetical protein
MTHLDAWSRQHSVDSKNPPFDAISQDTLAVTPHCVGGVGSANLAGSGTNNSYVNTVYLKELYFHMAQNGNILIYIIFLEQTGCAEVKDRQCQ